MVKQVIFMAIIHVNEFVVVQSSCLVNGCKDVVSKIPAKDICGS